MEYEQRIIAYIDLLGFKDLVKKKSCQDISIAIDILNDFTDESAPNYKSSRHVTQFSDSIVLSSSISETSAVFNTLYDLLLTISQLLHYGFLCRGGITTGQVLHNEKYLYGQAMNDAYEMESKKAKFPRVIVDEKLLEIARTYHASHHSSEQEEEYVEDILTKDDDGYYFIDYFGKVFSELECAEHGCVYITHITEAMNNLEIAIKKAFDEKAKKNLTQKYNWLAKKFNLLLQSLKSGEFYYFLNGETTTNKTFQDFLVKQTEKNFL